ncbi:beta-glucosidase [Ophiostoma piceae UAMH 11346]|uniref:beta-glucosidase n=1 Tax=Ophiostoma piceae (strain UAMH 11346) TaxID=1262450 RepID=S3CPV6_OPHP1|nr:beta-glucosidase [Ophiostoma piceae UAMH 11346]
MADFDVEEVIAELALHEKVSLVSGIDMWHTYAVPRLGVPSIRMSDGPNGVRGTRFFNGIPAACLPCETALGATFDEELALELGKLLGQECKAKGAHILLGPTINIQRGPLGGRGFESFSEDPVLSGTLAARYCEGVKEEGIIPTPKHFVCNDQEHERMAVNSILTDRALREIYLLPFQIAMQSNPGALMTSYNMVNGTHASESFPLLQDILRKEWGFDGLVMSDWFGVYSVSQALNAGLDIEMPGMSKFRGAALSHAVSSNEVKEHVLDESVRKVLTAVKRSFASSGIPENAPELQRNTPETSALLRRAAAESVVLLKNEGDILPLAPTKKTLVIGPNANIAAYCGGGSASLPAYYTVTPLQGIKNKIGEDKVLFSQGAYGHRDLPLIGDRLRTAAGEVGYTFSVFAESLEENPNRKPVEVVQMTSSNAFLMDYANKNISGTLYYVTMEGIFTPEESGLYDFGLSVAGTGQLFVEDKLVIDNKTKQRGGTAFFGMGTVEERGSVELEAGKNYKVHIDFGTFPTSKLRQGSVVSFGAGGVRFGGCRHLEEKPAIEEAVAAAKAAAAEGTQVVVCVGLNSDWESEGYDRPDMDLPPNTDELVQRVLDVSPDAVIVVQSGTPVTLPWVKNAKALVQAWYGGNEGGNGIADVLFGDVNPSAKLPLTFPTTIEQNPSFLNYRSEGGRVLYGEDIYVGYRYFDKVKQQPLFAFGYGLSYTTFAFTNLKVDEPKAGVVTEQVLTLTVDVTNTGKRDGAEVVQLYVSPPAVNDTLSGIRRPVRELKAFKKVALKAGETKTVTIKANVAQSTSFWDEKREAWQSEAGTYKLTAEGTGADNKLDVPYTVAKTQYWTGLVKNPYA